MLIILFLVLAIIFCLSHYVKPKKAKSRKKRTDVGKIYKTTDGYFTDNEKIKKPRRVAVVKQRKTDGAVAVVKIFSKKGKVIKKERFIDDLTLKPKKHSSLTEDSIVERHIHFGVKKKDGAYKAIHTRHFKDTNDKLTQRELKHVQKEMGGETKSKKENTQQKIKKWETHFRE